MVSLRLLAFASPNVVDTTFMEGDGLEYQADVAVPSIIGRMASETAIFAGTDFAIAPE